jgi:hypothetical protein
MLPFDSRILTGNQFRIEKFLEYLKAHVTKMKLDDETKEKVWLRWRHRRRGERFRGGQGYSPRSPNIEDSTKEESES